jgi:tetratricopeptide (TPR) repeat protein
MARAVKHKGKAKKQSRKAARPADKLKRKTAARRNPPSKAKLRSGKVKTRISRKTKKGKSAPARHPAKKERLTMEAESRKPASRSSVAAALEPPPRLLRQTKTTAAALALLGKGVELIFQRDFKKARGELKALLEAYPGELDILARARSYLQICDREEVIQKKPVITKDQLYSLGVLEHNRANYDTAISYFLQSLENHPNADYIYYSVAASLAMKGDLAKSLQNLRKAVELNEDSRIYAKNDADFSALQTQKEFVELVGLNQPPSNEPQH